MAVMPYSFYVLADTTEQQHAFDFSVPVVLVGPLLPAANLDSRFMCTTLDDIVADRGGFAVLTSREFDVGEHSPADAHAEFLARWVPEAEGEVVPDLAANVLVKLAGVAFEVRDATFIIGPLRDTRRCAGLGA